MAWQVTHAQDARLRFQQRVDHSIEVRLDDAAHVLHGRQSFTYHNNAPHHLDTLWVHLWPNAYRDRSSALDQQLLRDGDLSLHFATEEERGWIDSLGFKLGETVLTWGYHPKHNDIGWIKLPEAIAPGAQATITTPFRVKVPDSRFSRLGHTAQAYHITQWFPKPAVFDQDGWHAMPYLTQGEFYSDFGRYDVRITLPANYVVGATGMLQDNPAEEDWMNTLAQSSGVLARQGDPSDLPASDARMKTLRFVQDSVHDFAWFADKRFIVRKGSVTLERSGRDITTWALFTPRNAGLWERIAIESLNESVKHYSQWVGDYPYAACTAIDGTISAGGGMEYPMITIIGNMGSVESLDNVIAHEVGHNWFYGILASNEREHPWMDEGINSFVEMRYMRERYPNGGLAMVEGVPGVKRLTEAVKDGHRWASEAMYRINARRNLDQPIETCAHDYTQINYGGIVYSKTALVFDQLFAYLGEEVFDRCMQAYYTEWSFKHPRPEDVRNVFQRESGKDLSWMFDELIGTARKVDVKAVKLRGNELSYRSNAYEAFPFSVTAWKGDDLLGTQWYAGDTLRLRHSADRYVVQKKEGVHRGRATVRLPWTDADRVRIDAGARTLDIDRRNNEVYRHGLFRRCAKPELKWLMGMEKDDRRSVYWSPLVAWNGHDGIQLGLAAYNTVFPSQRTEWVVAPLYGFASEQLGGAARIEHHFDRIESRLFRNIHVGLNLRSASIFQDHGSVASYEKVAPHVVFDLRSDPLNRPWKHSISLRGIYINALPSVLAADAEGFPFPARLPLFEQYNVELRYTARDDRKLNPTLVEATLLGQDYDLGDRFLRASLEVSRGFTYNAKGDQLRLRAFGGMFLHNNAPLAYRLQTWGLSWGPEDLLYDHAYLERGALQGPTGRQFSKQQGAFKTPFIQGRSDDWVAAGNMEFDLPFGIPLSVFAGVGAVPFRTFTSDGTTITVTNDVAGYYEAGIGMQVVRDALELWVPLLVSGRIRDEEGFLGRSEWERIRFVFALERMDPTKALRRVKP